MPTTHNRDEHVPLRNVRGIWRVITYCAVVILLLLLTQSLFAQSLFETAQARDDATPLLDNTVVQHSATILLQNGTGQIVRDHKIIQLMPSSKLNAQPRDIVKAETGTIIITFFDGQSTTLLPGGELEIVFHQRQGEEQRVVLLQRSGRAINSVEKLGSTTSRFEVQTASSIAAVNKSEFSVELTGSDASRFSSNTGTVKVFSGSSAPVEVQSGYEATVQEDEEPTVAPMHNTRRTALFTKKAGKHTCPDARTQLMPPSFEASEKRQVEFYGTAMHEDFDYYKLEYTVVGRPANKYSWLYRGDEPVEDGLLGTVDLSELPAGEYVIRLQVVDKTGNYPEACLIDIEL